MKRYKVGHGIKLKMYNYYDDHTLTKQKIIDRV